MCVIVAIMNDPNGNQRSLVMRLVIRRQEGQNLQLTLRGEINAMALVGVLFQILHQFSK